MSDSYYATISFGPIPDPLGAAIKALDTTQPVDGEDVLVTFLRTVTTSPFDPMEVDDTPAGVVVTLTDSEASYGLDQWMNASGYRASQSVNGDAFDLAELLIGYGIPFIGDDAGTGEFPGQIVEWAPGMEEMHTVEAINGDDPVLSLAEYTKFRQSPDVLITDAIDKHFGIGIVPSPHPTSEALEQAALERAREGVAKGAASEVA